MLKVFFGEPARGVLVSPDAWFNAIGYKYLKTDFSKRVIRDVDGCKHIEGRVVESDKLGVIPCDWLSTGSKSAIMAMYTDYPLRSSWVGDNVIVFLREIGLKKDIVLIAAHCIELYSKRLGLHDNYKTMILNTNRIVTCGQEFIDEYEKALPNPERYDEYAIYRGN